MANISKLTDLTNQRNQQEYSRYSVSSYRWFIEKINNLRNPMALANQIKKETNRNTNKFTVGGLYYFYYNAKTAARLDYWDAFPLVIPLERYTNGFLGLNLHYLPVKIRAGFMDKLLDRAVLDINDDPMRIRISYQILDASKRYKEFRPCLKRYLYGHVASKILAVQPNEWETAVFLPTHQFQKAKASSVWEDSMDKIKHPNESQTVSTAHVAGQPRQEIK
jgi:hypothetical protein